MSLPYEVSRKFGQSTGKIIATFSDKSDAELFMKTKAEYDQKTKAGSIYDLIDSDEVVFSIDSKNASLLQQSHTSNNASTGDGFNPSPLSTSAKPAGFQSSFSNTKKDSNNEDL